METSLIGAILIWIGVLASLIRPAWLPGMTIFTLPFSGVAVLNVLQSGGYSGLQLPTFYGTLWLLHRMIQKPLWDEKQYPRSTAFSKGFFLLGLFCLSVLASLLMPLFIQEKIVVYGSFTSSHVYGLGLRYVTQYLYLLFGCLLAWVVCEYIQEKANLRKVIRAFVASALVMGSWGLFQFLSFYIGVAYPAEWIHTNLSVSATFYNATLNFGGIEYRRISSAATEPSLYAQSMMVILPWILTARLYRVTIWNEWVDSLTGSLLIVTLVLSTAASAYAGLVWLGILLAAWLAWQGRGRIIGCLIILSACTIIGAYYLVPAIHNLIAYGLMDKLTTGSGAERIFTVEQALKFFLQYPLLGMGWGSLTVHDLFFNVLGNTGIIGGITFWVFTGWLSKRSIEAVLKAKSTKMDPETAWIVTASAASFLTLLLLNLCTGFMYTYGHFWIVVGITLGVSAGMQRYCRM